MYDISIYIGNLWVQFRNKDKNKMNLPRLSFHSFLNYWKTTKSTKTLKFSDFQFGLSKVKSSCISGLFCIANLFEVGRKKHIFLILWILTPFKLKWNKIFYNKKIWCSLYKIIGNWWFISYNEFNLLGIAIKTFL